MAWRVISRITDSVKCSTLSLRKCLPRVEGRWDESFGGPGLDARRTFDHALGDFCRLDVLLDLLEARSAMAGRLAQSRGQASGEQGTPAACASASRPGPCSQSLAIPLPPRSPRFGREISPRSCTARGRGLWLSPPLPRDSSAARWFRENTEDASTPW